MSTVTSNGTVLETNGHTSVVRRGALLTVAGEQRLSANTTTIEGLEKTYRANRGYLLTKPSAGSSEVFHFDTDLSGFYTHENGKGASVNPEPIIDFSVAQGYEADAYGNLLKDTCDEKPILGPMVEFNDILISGTMIDGKTDKRLLALRATNSTVPLSLFMQNGKMTFREFVLDDFEGLNESLDARDLSLSTAIGTFSDSVTANTETLTEHTDSLAALTTSVEQIQEATGVGGTGLSLAELQAMTPKPWPYAALPTVPNLLVFNGGFFNANDYPKLYALLGSTQLPDWRGVTPRGVSGPDLSHLSGYNAAGSIVGEGLHTMTEEELVPHAHSQETDSGINEGVDRHSDFSVPHSGERTIDTGSTGGGDPFNVVGPSVMVNWIIFGY